MQIGEYWIDLSTVAFHVVYELVEAGNLFLVCIHFNAIPRYSHLAVINLVNVVFNYVVDKH